MKVTLFEDIKSEKWFSMDRYAKALSLELEKSSGVDLKKFSFKVPSLFFKGRRKFFWRFKAYPFFAQFFQGDINHIVDHSYARAIKHLEPKKTVVTCHDLIPLDYEEDIAAKDIFKETLSYLNEAARIIAVSKATKKDLVEKLKIDPKKIVVIYEGVGEQFSVPAGIQPQDSKQHRNRFNLPGEKQIILHVGNSLKYKNIEGLLEAFAAVKKIKKDIILVKVGNFTKEQINFALRRHLKIDKDIFERPGLSEDDLIAMYNLASVTCIPSYKEGFGFPVLESMACGTPVVCSNTSSLLEVGGKAAVYCNPKDPADIAKKLLKVLHFHKSSRESVVKKGLAQTAKLSWEKCAQETLKVYESL